MARYDHLPLWKDGVALATLLEEAVRRFPRYHKMVREEGYRKHGLEGCVLSEIGWPTVAAVFPPTQVPIFKALSPSGVRHVP